MTLEEMKCRKQERGYSMAQLSELSGVPLGTLQKIFTGETAHPRYATRQAIERVLGTPGALEVPPSVEGADVTVAYCEEDSEALQGYCVKESGFAYSVRRGKKPGEYTVEDYESLPGERRAELIDGMIYDMSSPGWVHQRIVSAVFLQIGTYIQRNNGSCIPMISPVDVKLDCDEKTMLQPDLVILCDHSKIKRWGILGAPDFVLEVISDSTRRLDYTKKLQKYADAGVKEYWIIDPKKHLLISYNFAEEDIPCIHPLEGKAAVALYHGELEIDLDEIADFIRDWPE